MPYYDFRKNLAYCTSQTRNRHMTWAIGCWWCSFNCGKWDYNTIYQNNLIPYFTSIPLTIFLCRVMYDGSECIYLSQVIIIKIIVYNQRNQLLCPFHSCNYIWIRKYEEEQPLMDSSTFQELHQLNFIVLEYPSHTLLFSIPWLGA